MPNRATRRRQKTHLDLLAALRTELATLGSDELTVSAVTERADVAIGTFYNHFDDKTSALEALAQLETEGLTEATGLILNARDSEDETEAAPLRRMLAALTLVIVHRSAVDLVWLKAMASLIDARFIPTPDVRIHQAMSNANPDADPRVLAWHARAVSAVGSELFRSLRSGEFPPSIDERLDLAIPSILGVIGCCEADMDRELEWAKRQPIPTEWPSTEAIIGS